MSEFLKVTQTQKTLVDLVEEKLIDYFKYNNLSPGDPIPKELELADSLGVGRSVLREALSRFRMLGIIESRTRRGMVLRQPDIFAGMSRVVDLHFFPEQELLDLIELRNTIEIGISRTVCRKITPVQIEELKDLVHNENVHSDGTVSVDSDFAFHSKLYEISGNQVIGQFNKVLKPTLEFIRDHYKEFFLEYSEERKSMGNEVDHKRLIELLEQGDPQAFRDGMYHHLDSYRRFIEEHSK